MEAMRKQLITISVLTVLLVIAWTDKVIAHRNLSRDWAFLYWMAVATCAVTVIVLSINCLIEGRKNPETPSGRKTSMNRRESFRVRYPESLRPTLIVEKVDNKAKRALQFPVLDLSEEGFCFMDDGTLGKAKTGYGRILFKNGEITTVAFDILRRHEKHISVRLQHPLPWAKLIREQQKLLVPDKKV